MSAAMTPRITRAECRSLGSPDEVRDFPKGRIELAKIGGGTVARITLEPGWRWSEHVKPIAGTELCEIAHFQYCIAGHLHVVMANGEGLDLRAGDVAAMPPGHDAWVVGGEPFSAIDWADASHYAQAA